MFRYVGSFMAYLFRFLRCESSISRHGIFNSVCHFGRIIIRPPYDLYAIGQFSTLVLSIDAPLRILLDNEDARQFVPSGLLKKNEHGAYINGIKMVICLSGSIILIQSFNTGLTMVNVPSFWQYVAKGGLLLFALTTDYIRKQKREKDLLAASMKNL